MATLNLTPIDDLAQAITALAEVNSGTFNPDGVNRCGEILIELLDRFQPDKVEHLDVEPTTVVDQQGNITRVGVGRAVRVTKNPDAPFRVCLFGHLDTVFPADSDFQDVTRNGTVLHGPGVADCKGGLVMATEVLGLLDDGIGWEFLAIADEEIGSASSNHLLTLAATNNHLGVGFEPALPSGGIAAARKGTITAHTVVTGTASHVGRAHGDGRSAILALARVIDQVEALNAHHGLTVNTGRISGGGPLNVVPSLAVGSYNMRVESVEDRDFAVDQFTLITAKVEAELEVEIELIWANERPPKVRTAELNQLIDDMTDGAREAGLELSFEDTGGCCDGNNLAAAGLPNLDSLGVTGGNIHSPNEFAELSSIPERAPVIANMITRAAQRHRAGTR